MRKAVVLPRVRVKLRNLPLQTAVTPFEFAVERTVFASLCQLNFQEPHWRNILGLCREAACCGCCLLSVSSKQRTLGAFFAWLWGQEECPWAQLQQGKQNGGPLCKLVSLHYQALLCHFQAAPSL